MVRLLLQFIQDATCKSINLTLYVWIGVSLEYSGKCQKQAKSHTKAYEKTLPAITHLLPPGYPLL